VQDITGAIKKSGSEVSYEISEQTRQVVASDQALARLQESELRELSTLSEGISSVGRQVDGLAGGIDRLRGTVAEGLGVVGQKLDILTDGIERLGAQFQWGLALLIEQARVQSHLLNGMLERLDAIHRTLETPTLTQAREFYRIGSDRLKKGLIDKALGSFLESEGKNDADFLTQFSLGTLYLYGYNDDCSVLDLQKAQKHFRDAARYAKAEIPFLPEARRYCGEAYLHASIAYYVDAKAKQQSGDTSSSALCLRETVTLAEKASAVCPELTEALFQAAKASALLGDASATVDRLAAVIPTDRNYCLKVDNDPDFNPARHAIAHLFSSLRNETRVKAVASIDAFHREVSSYLFSSARAREVETTLQSIMQDCRQLHVSGTYFDYLDILTACEKANNTLSCLLFPTCQVGELPHGSNPVYAFAFSPDGRFLASGSGNEQSISRAEVWLWDVRQRRRIAVLSELEQSIAAIAFSPDGAYLAAASNSDAYVQVWDVASRRRVASLNTTYQTTIAFSPDGRYFASADLSGNIYLCDVASWKPARRLSGWSTTSLAFSPDGRYLASGEVGMARGPVRQAPILWEVESGRRLPYVEDEDESKNAVAFSPDGRLLASGGQSVKLWTAPSRKRVATLESNIFVKTLAFSPGGRYLAAGGSMYSVDGKVWGLNFWDLSSEKYLSTVLLGDRFKTEVAAIAFSPDRRLFASAMCVEAEYGTPWVWEIRLWGPEIVSVNQQCAPQEVSDFEELAKRVTRPSQEIQQDKREDLSSAKQYREGTCIQCGRSLSFLERIGGKNVCKRCRRS